MVEDTREVITAIRDSGQEGFVAASLLRLGWSVVHRSTSAASLEGAIEKFPSATVVASEDFSPTLRSGQNTTVIIASTTSRAQSGKFTNPLSDFELQELLRSPKSDEQVDIRRVASIGTDVTVVASIESGIGASTLALNIAQEFAHSGYSTLLLELNQSSPFLSEYLDISHINRGIVATALGFSVGEVNSVETLNRFSEEAQSFDRVVLDVGKLDSIDCTIRGNRMTDISTTWALQSSSRILLLVRSGEKLTPRIQRKVQEFKKSALNKTPMIGVVFQSAVGRKERNEVKEQLASLTHAQVALFSRDFSAVSKAAAGNTTLISSSAKSVLRGEILSQLISPLIAGRSMREAKVR